MAEPVAGVLELAAYFVFAEALQDGQVSYPAWHSGWLNKPLAIQEGFPKTSHSMNVAHRKLGELLDMDPEVGEGQILRTPRPGLEYTSGWKGGVRIGPYIICVSKLAPEHDQLFAALMFSASWQKGKAEFDRVVDYHGIPVVVLKSQSPEASLRFISEVCEVPIDDFFFGPLKTNKALLIRRTSGDYGPVAIGVAVEKL